MGALDFDKKNCAQRCAYFCARRVKFFLKNPNISQLVGHKKSQ